MAYLPGFEYDIFISYAHVDNLTPFPEEKGWIDQFHAHLEIMISRRFGRQGMVRFWRDRKLDGSQLFDKTIHDSIGDSALLIAFTSNGYLESDYCRKELKWFSDKAKNDEFGLTVGDRYRILNVLLTNIHHDNWPAEFGRTSGFSLHDAANEDETGEPSDTTAKAFMSQLRKLVEAIEKILHEFKAQIDQGHGRPQSKVEQPSVFFADVAESLSITQKRTITDLKDSGVHILNRIPPPYDPAEAHEQAAIEEMGKAILTVHQLNEYPGREIDGEFGLSYPQKQLNLALEHAGSQILWVPPKMDIEAVEDEDHKNFLKRIERHPRKATEFEFVRSPATDLTQVILEKIDQIMSRAKPAPTGAAPSVLVDTHTKDHLHAIELSNFLVGKQIMPFINPIEDNPQQNMDKFEQRLKQVSKLIIIYGDVAKDWVLERINVVLQLIIIKNYPIDLLGIYLAPPHKNPADILLNQRFINVHLINNSDKDDFDPETLTPLFENLGQRGALR